MICSRENKSYIIALLISLSLLRCGQNLPKIEATIITEETPHDTDDPAIWVNHENPENSIVFGTDKDEINGGVYAYDLNGKIIEEKSLTGLSYPNNVDVAYDFKINDSTTTDILVFTEREKHQIRIFSIPNMKALDAGGFKVFNKEKETSLKRPMGIATFYDKLSNKMYLIVSRKEGPLKNYLHQYEVVSDSSGIRLNLSRSFGDFSGKKEIEAIAVDQELGYIYYSDEDHGVRKYYARPEKGNKELSCFGKEHFKRDVEGIAIAKYGNDTGYIIVSNQQAHTFCVFDRMTNAFIKEINLGTVETDGCEVTTTDLGALFPNGLFVSMTDDKTFHYHDLKRLNLKKD